MLVVAFWIAVALGVLYVYSELQRPSRDGWKRLPGRPGLPPDMEYQFWTPASVADPAELSDAVVAAVDCLSLCFGRTTLFSILRGSGILIYDASTYPADECNEVVVRGLGGPYRRIAVERNLVGLAHAIAHAIDRYAGTQPVMHCKWIERGIEDACAVYERKRKKQVGE